MLVNSNLYNFFIYLPSFFKCQNQVLFIVVLFSRLTSIFLFSILKYSILNFLVVHANLIRNSKFKCLSESAEWNESRLAKLLLCFIIVNDSISKLIMLTYNVTDRLSLVSLVLPIVFFFVFVLSKSMHFAKYCFYYSTKINKQKKCCMGKNTEIRTSRRI